MMQILICVKNFNMIVTFSISSFYVSSLSYFGKNSILALLDIFVSCADVFSAVLSWNYNLDKFRNVIGMPSVRWIKYFASQNKLSQASVTDCCTLNCVDIECRHSIITKNAVFFLMSLYHKICACFSLRQACRSTSNFNPMSRMVSICDPTFYGNYLWPGLFAV